MNSAKNYVLAFFVLTTVGGAILAWRQYGELVELRARALNRTEREDLQQRITDLERMNRDLQLQLAALRGDSAESLIAEATGENSPSERSGRERGRGGDGPGRGGFDVMRQQQTALRELMAKPEVQAMISLQQKAGIEARYGALFKNLNLTPEQSEKLKTLLADRGNTRRDVEEVARAQGIDPRQNPDAYRKLFTDAQNELNNSIRSVIGDHGFAQLQNYEQTMPQRNVVENLQQRLASTNTPLSAAQAEQLVQILAVNAPPRTTTSTNTTSSDRSPSGRAGPGFGPPGGPGGFDMGRIMGGGPGGPPTPTAVVTPGAVAQAQTVLAPPQVAALQKIQQQQQTQQQLQQLIRDTITANTPTNTKSGGTTGSTGTGTPRKRGGGG